MNLLVRNALRKIAGEPTADDYYNQRSRAMFNPGGRNGFDALNARRGFIGAPNLGPYLTANYVFPNLPASALPDARAKQARDYSNFFATPGSNLSSDVIKYLIERGENNWYNFNNPKAPRKNPEVPASVKDKKMREDLDTLGNTIVDNSNYGRFGNIG